MCKNLFQPNITAEEAVDFLLRNYRSGKYIDVFGDDYGFEELKDVFTPKEIVSRISQYKASQNIKIETVNVCRIIEKTDNRKTCVYEQDLVPSESPITQCKRILKDYCGRMKDGEFFAVIQPVYRAMRL